MRQVRQIMGMPVTVELIAQPETAEPLIQQVFGHFIAIDEQYSTYKPGSEISKINAGELQPPHYSPSMQHILELCKQTKRETNGYFDIEHNGRLDPSGLVKGWAIWQAAGLLRHAGQHDFFISAGGDMELNGMGEHGQPWQIGIRSPFNQSQIIKRLRLTGHGVATSGTYIRGQHIYNPFSPADPLTEIVSLTVIGPNIYEADRFATAAFAMGRAGIGFIASRTGLEGYMIDVNGNATFTDGFGNYVL
jgi:FAD:protein FMN transferase